MRSELFIDDAWRAGAGPTFTVEDPATGETVWSGAEASTADIRDAFAAATRAFDAWSQRPLAERVAIARRFAEEMKARAGALAEVIARETGKVLWDCQGEAQSVIGKVDLSIRAQAERAGAATQSQPFGALALEHRPHGVMAVFGPFNFPAHLPNGHIVPALLAGNTVVFKPSELAPSAGALMAQAWEAAGLPPGVLNLVHGGRGVGEALLDGEGLRGVLFTGSASAGAAIHRHFAGRPDVILALELGGNNALIVWPPADVAAAANLIAQSAFVTSGQRCSCARRLVVPDDAFGAAVIEATAALAKDIAVGAWNADPPPFMGPLVRPHAAQAAQRFAGMLEAAGGRPLTRFERDGAFVRPHIVDMTSAAEVADEECFGPVLQVFRAPSLQAALARANATRFGLSGGLICDDPAFFEIVRTRLRVGVLNWNRPTTGASGALPFGGPGLSGSGRPSAYYAADYCAYPVAMQQSEKAAPIPAPGLPR